MAALYLDEHLTPQAIPLFQALGHLAEHGRDHQVGVSDHKNLLLAWRRGWAMVTNDADYVELHNIWHLWSRAWTVPPAEPAPQHGGVLLARNGWPREVLVANVHQLFLAPSPLPLANRLYAWQDGHGWVEIAPSPD